MSSLGLLFISIFGFSVNHVALQADLETEPVASSGDAADDSAFWIHPSDASKSLIIGTDKQWGLVGYDLQGKKVSDYPAGRVNNIDGRDGFLLDGQKVQIFAGSERSREAIDFYVVENEKNIRPVGSLKLSYEPYGICVGFSQDQSELFIFITTKSGKTEQWSLKNDSVSIGKNAFRLVQSFNFSSVTEGCVLDDKRNFLYVGQENKGLWRINLSSPKTPFLVDHVGKGGNLVPDVEGVSIYERPGTEPLLVVSSQGDNSFHLYNLETMTHRGSFQITDGVSVDGVNDTDGIDISSVSFNAQFPDGIMVAQDGSNKSSTGKLQKQNFKILSFGKVLKLLK